MPAPDRKRRLTAFLVAMAVLIATPLAVVAADAFTDVPASNVFHEDIAWLAAAGVTKGCNPPANTEFCPSDNVTREQMSAFMRRLAQYMDAEDGTPALADHATTAGSATTAASASNADTLDGQNSTAYQTNVVGVTCEVGTTTVCPSMATADPAAAILTATIDAPTPGTLVLDSVLVPTDDVHISWLAVNDTCGVLFSGTEYAPNGVVGSLAFYISSGTIATSSPSAAVAVGAGSHTVRLCGFAGGPGVVSASLTASWTEGTSGIASAGSPAGAVDPSIVEKIQDAFGS